MNPFEQLAAWLAVAPRRCESYVDRDGDWCVTLVDESGEACPGYGDNLSEAVMRAFENREARRLNGIKQEA